MNFFSLFKRNLISAFKKKINIDPDKQDNKSLENLFIHFGSDKANIIHENHKHIHAGKKIGHGFSHFYEKHLKKFKDDKIKILEIGSLQGASAASFAKYFSQSTIYCLDINLRNFKYSSKKIEVFGINASNEKMINKFLTKIKFNEFVKSFDIIIDDGSHKQSDQLLSLNILYKHVSKGGFYIIEDYKFPNYFKHLNDVDDLKIDELINKVNKKENFSSKLISNETIDILIKSLSKIYEYRGNTDYSDIVFFEKKTTY